jgi:hypothetical protein
MYIPYHDKFCGFSFKSPSKSAVEPLPGYLLHLSSTSGTNRFYLLEAEKGQVRSLHKREIKTWEVVSRDPLNTRPFTMITASQKKVENLEIRLVPIRFRPVSTPPPPREELGGFHDILSASQMRERQKL